MSPAARRRARRTAIALAVAAGFALRAYFATARPGELVGDEAWYTDTAAAFRRDGLLTCGPECLVRPPGTSLWLAGLFAVFGAGNVAAVVMANIALSALCAPLVAGLARRAMPRVRWAPVAFAWIWALDPTEITGASLVLSERVAVPLTLLFVWLCMRRRVPRLRDAALASLAGAALIHVRADCLPIVLAGMAFAVLAARRRGRFDRTALLRWTLAGIGAVALCVPWSAHVSARTGRTSFVANGLDNTWFAGRRGFGVWLSNVSLPRAQWLHLYWQGPRLTSAASIPPEAYESQEEARAVQEILARARDGASDAEIDGAFQRLGEERSARHPVRFFLVLPLERAARIWLDVTDSDLPPDPPPDGLLRRLFAAWTVAFRIALALGFLLSPVAAFRRRHPAALPAALVLVRTLSIVFAGPFLFGVAVFEGRQMNVVEPLALLAGAAVLAGFRPAERRAPTSS